MVRIYVKGLGADKTNYQNLMELRKIKGIDKKIRYEIIFYDTFIGSHGARKNHPEKFSEVRYITGSIFEADYISKQREKTLEELDKRIKKKKEKISKLDNKQFELIIKKVSENILAKLRKKAELLNFEKVEYTHGLYGYLYQIENNSIERIGNRLEESLTAHKRIIKNLQEEREIKYFFMREADCMSGVLFRVLDEIQKL